MKTLFVFLLQCFLFRVACISAEVVRHKFQVQAQTVQRLCENQVITTVNGLYPGPTVYVREGDTLVVNVINESPYNISIHWHGVSQLLSGWADGAGYVTQCPILPGNSYVYKFNITQQEGTLLWHAHVANWLRATVHGALIIYPKHGHSYPFKKPYKEFPILLGEWWNANILDVENSVLTIKETLYISDAFTINGKPGDFYPCSSKDMTHKLKVKQGKTYMLRIINVGLNFELYFKIANHMMKVVAVDACYVNPYLTDVVVVAPGQTTDVLLKADQPPMLYYMVARPYITFSDKNLTYVNSITSAILSYKKTLSERPILPDIYNVSTVRNFLTSLTGLTTGPFWALVPQVVDEHMFITIALGLVPSETYRNISYGSVCRNKTYADKSCTMVIGTMNNVTFKLPTDTKMSMLEAFPDNLDETIYTTDFPKEPPLKFDYTNPINQFDEDLLGISERATKVTKLKYNATVEIVLQNTILITEETHPIHLHGYNFHVLAQGVGNYDKIRDEKKYNLVNPHQRNTIGVPAGGWVVIRFQANNPGVWLLHCHLETHVTLGLATAFVVENGPTQSTSLPLPPLDLPKCEDMNTDRANGKLGRVLPIEKSIAMTNMM